jgi:Spy/CpxP family protein refolding chaperone
MKFTVAVLALFVALSSAPVMASVADSAGSNSGFEAHHRHHHHHRRHHHMNETPMVDLDAVSASVIG